MSKNVNNTDQNIFIWSSYGDVKVYALDTIEDYQKLYNEIKNVLIDYRYIVPFDGRRNLNIDPLTKAVKDADTYIAKWPDSTRAIHVAITEVLWHLDRDDNFGYGTEISKLKTF